MTKQLVKIEDINQQGRDVVAIEWIDNNQAVIHFIHIPNVSEPGFYRTAISLEYYRNRELTGWYDKYHQKGKVCPRRFTVKFSYEKFVAEVARTEDNLRKYVPGYVDNLRTLPIFEHESLWEFYKFIGYDYKTQKYTKEQDNA